MAAKRAKKPAAGARKPRLGIMIAIGKLGPPRGRRGAVPAEEEAPPVEARTKAAKARRKRKARA